MTKKQETINAMIETAERYERPVGHLFFDIYYCLTCKIHCNWSPDDKMPDDKIKCHGCPLASSVGTPGCSDFRTYRSAYRAFRHGEYINPPEFLDRAASLRKHAEICKAWPEERFTVDGWIYSGKELSRDD